VGSLCVQFSWYNLKIFFALVLFIYGVYPQRKNMVVQNVLGVNKRYRYLSFDLLYCDGLRNKCFSKVSNVAVLSPPQTQGYIVDWSVNMKSYFIHITEDMKWIWCSKFWTVGLENLVLYFWTVSLLTHTFTDQWQSSPPQHVTVFPY